MKLRRMLLALAAFAAGAALPLSAQQSLNAVWGSGPNDIWTVGSAPVALHWDGHAWNEVPVGVKLEGSLEGIWGSGPRDVFAVGGGGMILHFGGESWTRMQSPSSEELVAVGGRGPRDVYAIAQSENDRQAPQLLHYDGTAWTATPLPFPFRATGLAVAGGEVVVAGFVYFDPQPKERRQVGVVARWSGGRWTTQGWDGQRVGEPVPGSAGWTRVSAGGGAVLLFGQREDGTQAIALSTAGGAWTALPPAASAMSRAHVRQVALAGDPTPLALYEGSSFARFTGGRWVAVSGQDRMMQMMSAAQQSPAAAAQMQQMMMQMGARMAAYEMSQANAVWGTSAADFFVVTGEGRIVHVHGDDAMIVYDAACGNPAAAGMNPICQALQAKPQ